jgi:hypothetical protein
MLAWELAWELAWKWAGICRERRTPAWISVPIAAEATRAPVVITTFEPAPRMPAGLQLPAPAQSELMAPVHADLLSVLSQELTSHSQPCPKRRPSPPGLASYRVVGSRARARRSLFDALIKPILQVTMHKIWAKGSQKTCIFGENFRGRFFLFVMEKRNTACLASRHSGVFCQSRNRRMRCPLTPSPAASDHILQPQRFRVPPRFHRSYAVY